MEKSNWNAYGFLWRNGNEKVKQNPNLLSVYMYEINIYIKTFGFYLSLDNAGNPNVWIFFGILLAFIP